MVNNIEGFNGRRQSRFLQLAYLPPNTTGVRGLDPEKWEFQERIEPLVPKTCAHKLDVDMAIFHLRAGWEGPVRKHFGSEIVGKVFEQFKKKLAESSIISYLSYKRMV
ncbi:loganic acid O-methyltransferase-like [Fagus crenata]|jgi:hypothetical protein